jgi:hypothetical protein
MLGTLPLDAMSEEDLLDFADARAEEARRAEVDLLRAAYQWSVLHDPDRLDPRTSAQPGREDWRMFGGAGTPRVTEFAAAELGARIGRSTYAAAQLIADAQDLHHRLPQLWSRVQAGEVRASYARHVTARTRDLSEAEAAHVDAEVAPYADGRIPWSRFEALVTGKVAAAAPALTRRREEARAEARFAKKCHGEAHGMATFMVRADVATIEQIDAAVTRIADGLTETMPHAEIDDRRVRAVLLMANPGATPDTPLPDLLPHVQLYLHCYDGPTTLTADGQPTGGVARVEGHGPVTEAWINRVLGTSAHVKVQPVLDLAGQAPVDAYEIPERHRRAVHLMTPADTFPFASCTSRQMQVDHTVPHSAGGPSGVGNYGPMTTTHHRIKTHAGWQVQQPFPGIYVWRAPQGTFYLVDHTGTRRLRQPDSSPAIDLFRRYLRLEYAAA